MYSKNDIFVIIYQTFNKFVFSVLLSWFISNDKKWSYKSTL